MSQDGELLAGRDDVASRPRFDQARRGYDKQQVDGYVERVVDEVAALVAERDRAFDQARTMATQLQQTQAELAQRQPYVDRASFRHLGPMVDQILALAEKQAEAIISAAEQHHSERQAEGEKLVSDAQERATQTVRELEAELAARREEYEKAHDEQAAAHQQQLMTARQQIQAGQQALTQLQTELATARQRLAQTRQEGATIERDCHQLTQRLGQVRQELTAELTRLEEARHAADTAESHAREVRARVQREAKRVADLAAAAVLAAATGGADTGEYRLVPGLPVPSEPASP